MKYGAIVVLAAASFAGPSKAQWMHQEHGGAFDGNAVQMAIAASASYGLALRCRNSDDLEIIYLTPEATEAGTIEVMNAASPTLLLRVDENEMFELAATLELANDGTVTAISDAPITVPSQVNSATTRVAAALKILGQVFHETEFKVNGSTAATNVLSEKCGLSME
ncbi:hypothetical protein [Oceaniovalibus guishaninsula]|uniref:hypothetical protein n=1 Tax=Oceaniovalibus guishaninsula TaxID=1046117 RepID=UPI0012EA1B96|nr:hypothetical protein [Oceaniovalibus guishaninsula]